MGSKDLVRAKVMEMVVQGHKSLGEAAGVLKISYRQAKRVYRRYREEGERGLVHGNVGRPSHHRIADELRCQAVELYREQYPDFGPTLAAEKLEQRHELIVDHETLRRWLMAEGLWERKRNRHTYRQRRRRRARFGELVQFDGSHHEWFEERGQSCCLMNMVDDATGKTFGFLTSAETTVAAMRLLWGWIERYGIPQALYCDRKNAFVLDREPTIEEQLRGISAKSPFELVCEKLGIEVIVAHSPQAKGRVERNHGVYQDRLVKELRLRGISDIETANRYLDREYLQEVNGKFEKSPAQPEDAHVPLLAQQDLRNVICFEEHRVVSRDYVVHFERRCYQILKEQRRHRPRPEAKVTVRKWLDESVHIFWQDKELLVEEIVKPKRKEAANKLSA
jgi:transposase